jgi:hypothetical protein
MLNAGIDHHPRPRHSPPLFHCHNEHSTSIFPTNLHNPYCAISSLCLVFDQFAPIRHFFQPSPHHLSGKLIIRFRSSNSSATLSRAPTSFVFPNRRSKTAFYRYSSLPLRLRPEGARNLQLTPCPTHHTAPLADHLYLPTSQAQLLHHQCTDDPPTLLYSLE